MAGPPLLRDANIDMPVAIQSVRGLRLAASERGEDLQLRISAPVCGEKLPLVLFAHGHGSSMDGYAPLADYWAAHGFVVIQPTFLDARRLGLAVHDPRRPSIWRTRVDDMKRILDHLGIVESALLGLAGRTDRDLIAAAGHSFGGQTVSMLLGAQMVGDGDQCEDMSDPRIKAGILLASGGRGGAELSDLGRQITPYLNSGFTEMTTRTLVVAGDADQSPLTVRGPDWFTDPFHLSPGGEALLTLHGGEHMLGGISGYEVTETTDENPGRVAIIQEITLAYLRLALRNDRDAWTSACRKLEAQSEAARIQTKGPEGAEV
ncbi:alpha/beta hydrolase family protein [Rhizobium wenxiniae]|uniref:alpha/beta hydrolase family protein n=1 Tax=Rhizobium wenxiniae TaxID=1737357 RepID=UPI003C168877